MSIKYTVEDIRNIAHQEYGLTLLSKTYHNNRDLLKWKQNSTGVAFQKSWGGIRTNPRPQKTRLDNFVAVKSFIESYKGLGYLYNQTEDEYNNLRLFGGKNKAYTISHPELDEDWVTTLSAFKVGAVSRLNKTGRSVGELLVETVLKENVLEYERQYRVDIEGQLHIFDFLLPEFNLFIEYDGEQHFRESSGYLKGKLGERKSRDKEKERYAELIGYTVLRIPYTNNTLSGVTESIADELNLPLKVGTYIPRNFQREVHEYYNSHSLMDTASHFDISTTVVTSTYKLVAGKTIREAIRDGDVKRTQKRNFRRGDPEEIANFYESHSMKETKDKFNISSSTLRKYYILVKGHTKDIKKYVEQNNVKRPLRLSLESVRTQAREKYNVTLLTEGEYTGSKQVLTWQMDETGEVFEKTWKNLVRLPRPNESNKTYKQVKTFIETYRGLGYLYEQTEEQYIDAPVVAGDKKYVITHPDLPEPWVTTISGFKEHADTHIKKYLPFTPSNLQQEVAEFYKDHTLKETTSKFKINGSTVNDYYILVTGQPKNPKSAPISQRHQKMVEFYDTHTLKETVSKFGMHHSTVNRYYTRVKGHPKNPKHAKQART